MSIDKNDKLTDVKTVLDESSEPYFTDVYSPWETKEQLKVWEEVESPSIFTGTIDTSLVASSTDNVYNLSVPNPDWKILSIWITWAGEYNQKTFKIWFFWNSSLAYSTLETELINWLWEEYIVAYISGTNYSIQRLDKQELTKSEPGLVRDITLNSWNVNTKITIIIDGTSTTIDWATYPLVNDALDYVTSQLPWSTYYYFWAVWWVVSIARIDGSIPVITSTQFNRYTYNVIWYATIVNGSDYTNFQTTIDGTLFSYSRASDPYTYTYLSMPIGSYNYAPRDRVWTIVADLVYTNIWAWYTLWTITVWSTSWVDYQGYEFPLQKTDYTQISWGVFTVTVNWSTGVSNGFSMTETNHLASITISVHTEIAIVLSLTSNNFFIPVWIRYNKIVISATSSTWSSEWVYELRNQSCTAKYWSTTEFVSNKIFKTDASNYWNIVSIKRGWFVINFTTNTSNKLNFTCT